AVAGDGRARGRRRVMLTSYNVYIARTSYPQSAAINKIVTDCGGVMADRTGSVVVDGRPAVEIRADFQVTDRVSTTVAECRAKQCMVTLQEHGINSELGWKSNTGD